MAYKQSPGRMNMPKTGAGIPSALTMPDPKDPSKKNKPKKTSKFPGYDNIPNAKPYKRNPDGSVNMITDKGSTYSLRRGIDK